LFSLEPNIIQNDIVIPENANKYDLQFNLFTKENSDKTLRYANYFETQKNCSSRKTRAILIL
jgi:hypothetical protein